MMAKRPAIGCTEARPSHASPSTSDRASAPIAVVLPALICAANTTRAPTGSQPSIRQAVSASSASVSSSRRVRISGAGGAGPRSFASTARRASRCSCSRSIACASFCAYACPLSGAVGNGIVAAAGGQKPWANSRRSHDGPCRRRRDRMPEFRHAPAPALPMSRTVRWFTTRLAYGADVTRFDARPWHVGADVRRRSHASERLRIRAAAAEALSDPLSAFSRHDVGQAREPFVPRAKAALGDAHPFLERLRISRIVRG